jgi:hypothetical protein
MDLAEVGLVPAFTVGLEFSLRRLTLMRQNITINEVIIDLKITD